MPRDHIRTEANTQNTTAYYISQLVRALLLVNLAVRTLLHGPLNSKVCFSRYANWTQKYLTNLVFSVRTVSYGFSFGLGHKSERKNLGP